MAIKSTVSLSEVKPPARHRSPLEVNPKIRAHVMRVLSSAGRSELDKGLALFRSILPASRSFTMDATKFKGMSAAEGGLELQHADPRYNIPGRTFTPAAWDVFETPAGIRVAGPTEYSMLLMVLLRTAGINAGVKVKEGKTSVIATFDGKHYQLDATIPAFRKTSSNPTSDREIMAAYFFRRAQLLEMQGANKRAYRRLSLAQGFSPGFPDVTASQVRILLRECVNNLKYRNYAQAGVFTNQALSLSPDNHLAKAYLAHIYFMTGRIAEAKTIIRELKQEGISFAKLIGL